MYYTDTIQSCLYLLNKYRWMAGDTSTPETGHSKEEARERKPQRKLTDEERSTIIRMHKDGRTITDIVNATNRCNAVIHRALARAGLVVQSRYRRITQEDVNMMQKLFREGMRPMHISRTLNIPNTTVHKYTSHLKT